MNLKKDVTLICVDGVNPDIAYKSIRFCNKKKCHGKDIMIL